MTRGSVRCTVEARSFESGDGCAWMGGVPPRRRGRDVWIFLFFFSGMPRCSRTTVFISSDERVFWLELNIITVSTVLARTTDTVNEVNILSYEVAS